MFQADTATKKDWLRRSACSASCSPPPHLLVPAIKTPPSSSEPTRDLKARMCHVRHSSGLLKPLRAFFLSQLFLSQPSGQNSRHFPLFFDRSFHALFKLKFAVLLLTEYLSSRSLIRCSCLGSVCRCLVGKMCLLEKCPSFIVLLQAPNT
jgi:hypothetical protein